MVSGSSIRSTNLFKDIVVALTSAWGGESMYYTHLLDETTACAVSRMQAAAAAKGATAIIHTRFQTNSTMNRLIFGMHVSVTAYGSAIRPTTSI